MTHHGPFRLSIAVAVGLGFAYLGWLFRENKKTVVLIGMLFAFWRDQTGGEGSANVMGRRIDASGKLPDGGGRSAKCRIVLELIITGPP